MRHFTTLDTMEHIKTFIQDHPLVLLYFSQPNCSVCHGLRPQVAELMAQYPNIQMGHINTHKVPAVAGHFSIFTVPVILLFVSGKEYLREARIVQLQRFDEKIHNIYINVTDSE